LRSFIDEFEPSTHKFIPLAVKSDVDPQGSERPFFLLSCAQRVDAIIVEQTAFRAGWGRAGFEKEIEESLATDIPLSPGGSAELSLAPDAMWTVSADATRGKHFWRLPRRFSGKYMCSDAFRQRYGDIRLSGLDFARHCPEV
jgi:hypothetical protein